MKKLLLFSFILMLLSITFQGFSCTSEAGLNDTICGVEYTLNADTSGLSGMIGTWSSNFSNTSFADIYDPGTSINIPNTFSLPGGPIMGTFGDTGYVNIQLYWTVAGSSYTSTDTVTITFYQVPEAYAGPDDAVCGMTYTMEAEKSIGSSVGEWIMISGPSSIQPQYVDKFDPHTEVNVPMPGEYVFQWQESNAQNPINTCATYDNVTIYFLEIPNPAVCPDQIVCGPDAFLCQGNIGNGFWSFNPTILNPSDPYPSVHITYLSQTHTETYVWNELNSYAGLTCTGKDSCHISFLVEPVAFAGLDDSVTNTLIYDLEGAFSTIETEGSWQGAIGVNAPMFYDPSDPSTNVTVLNYGLHEFIWEERSIYDDSCSSVDTVKILFIEGLAISNELQNSKIKLLQNTPNPFTAITEISFLLHKPEHISLTIYDLFGKKIKVLIDDKMLQGEQKIELSGDKLKPGIYFYTLQTKTQNITRKICRCF